MSAEPEKKAEDCGCSGSAGQLADKICLKIGGVAGEDTMKVCMVMTEDLKNGKIKVSDWVKNMGKELKSRNVSPEQVEKAFTEAITELTRP